MFQERNFVISLMIIPYIAETKYFIHLFKNLQFDMKNALKCLTLREVWEGGIHPILTHPGGFF